MLLALDEAFAGVDERNISAMFELVGVLDFDYIMNSSGALGLLCQRQKPGYCRAAPPWQRPRWSRSCITTGMALSGYWRGMADESSDSRLRILFSRTSRIPSDPGAASPKVPQLRPSGGDDLPAPTRRRRNAMLSAACLAAPSPRRFSSKPRTLKAALQGTPYRGAVLKDCTRVLL